LQLGLGVFATIKLDFNYFGHSYNYDAIYWKLYPIGWMVLNLFSSINRLISPISCNSHQISYILNIFYGDLGVYFMYILTLYL